MKFVLNVVNKTGRLFFIFLVLVLLGCGAERPADSSSTSSAPAVGSAPEQSANPLPKLPKDILSRLQALSPEELPGPIFDATNQYADDPRAAALGKKLFFDKRFSGQLLSPDNTGETGTLGVMGDVQKVSCADCHIPKTFSDTRSTRRQVSLGSGWTRRKTPGILDFGQMKILMWDGRRDSGFSQVFGVIENPLEFNSSRLFYAQQIYRLYRAEYESVFGPMPDISSYEQLSPQDAGCTEMPADELKGRCFHDGYDDDKVIRIVVNASKAIAAYERQLTCGQSRFDEWMHGNPEALTEDEQAGAQLFITSGCDSCHSGPFLSDQQFYNIGISTDRVINFIPPFDDFGAVVGLTEVLTDPLNSRGKFSDGSDDRLASLPDLESPSSVGAFRTPMLRCVGMRPSFMHTGQFRTLTDVVAFFNKGGDERGLIGVKDKRIVPLGLSDQQTEQLVAFLLALNGPGPSEDLVTQPELPIE